MNRYFRYVYQHAAPGAPASGGAAPPGGAPNAPPGGGGDRPPIQGGTGDPAAPGGAPGGGAPGAPGAAPAWYDGFQNPDVKEWLKAYGNAYPTPEAAATKAFQLEKFLGADKAGRGVIVPKADAKPEEWTEFYRKSGGAAATADGYKVPEPLAKDELALDFQKQAHEWGMPVTHFNKVLEWFGQRQTKLMEGNVAAMEQKAEKELNDLYGKWGADKDKNIEVGRRAARQFIPHASPEELGQILTSIEGAIGSGRMMQFLANVGSGLQEQPYHGGSGGGSPGGGMSPEAARMRIGELKKDPAWGAKFANGDAEAKAEFDKLNRIGYGQK